MQRQPKSYTVTISPTLKLLRVATTIREKVTLASHITARKGFERKWWFMTNNKKIMVTLTAAVAAAVMALAGCV